MYFRSYVIGGSDDADRVMALWMVREIRKRLGKQINCGGAEAILGVTELLTNIFSPESRTRQLGAHDNPATEKVNKTHQFIQTKIGFII